MQLPRLRFSLFALFAFTTLVCLVLAWSAQPNKCVVESLFHLGATQPVLIGDSHSTFDPQEFALYRKTQGDSIRSEFVIIAALRDPKIAALPVISSQTDQVSWVRDWLEVQSSDDSELLTIKMHCAEGAVNDCEQIINAISDAYLNEVVFAEEQRKTVQRDALQQSISKLQQELTKKISALKSNDSPAGASDAKDVVKQTEIEATSDILRELLQKAATIDVNRLAPPRVRLIQKAISRPE